MPYDTTDYDRVKHTQAVNTFARLRDVNNEQQRRDADAYVGALADKLRSIFTASPEAYGHIDPDAAAVLLLERWPRPRYERF